jgi:hypothetical protein
MNRPVVWGVVHKAVFLRRVYVCGCGCDRWCQVERSSMRQWVGARSAATGLRCARPGSHCPASRPVRGVNVRLCRVCWLPAAPFHLAACSAQRVLRCSERFTTERLATSWADARGFVPVPGCLLSPAWWAGYGAVGPRGTGVGRCGAGPAGCAQRSPVGTSRCLAGVIGRHLRAAGLRRQLDGVYTGLCSATIIREGPVASRCGGLFSFSDIPGWVEWRACRSNARLTRPAMSTIT